MPPIIPYTCGPLSVDRCRTMSVDKSAPDWIRLKRVLTAMSGAGALYIGSTTSGSQMVITSDLLPDSAFKKLIEPYLYCGTPLAGISALPEGRFAAFWGRAADEAALDEALGVECLHQVWSDELRRFQPELYPWPTDYVFSQFLLLVNLGKIELPIESGKVFCPFCGGRHTAEAGFTQCGKHDDDFARFKAMAQAIH